MRGQKYRHPLALYQVQQILVEGRQQRLRPGQRWVRRGRRAAAGEAEPEQSPAFASSLGSSRHRPLCAVPTGPGSVSRFVDPLSAFARRDAPDLAIKIEIILGAQTLVQSCVFEQRARPLAHLIALGEQDRSRKLWPFRQSGVSRPSSSRMVVVFPEPLGPRKP